MITKYAYEYKEKMLISFSKTQFFHSLSKLFINNNNIINYYYIKLCEFVSVKPNSFIELQ